MARRPAIFLLGMATLVLQQCAPDPIYRSPWGPSLYSRGFSQTGWATYYGRELHGDHTASGETFDMYGYTAAHPTLPLGTRVKVTNLENGLSAVVRINDRGPFVERCILDLSYQAAHKIGMIHPGTALVRIEVVGYAP